MHNTQVSVTFAFISCIDNNLCRVMRCHDMLSDFTPFHLSYVWKHFDTIRPDTELIHNSTFPSFLSNNFLPLTAYCVF